MRVRFLNIDSSDKIIIINNLRYSKGNIVCLPDNVALGYIHENDAEAYNYPIPDDEIIRLHKEFIDTSDFKRKVEILIYSYSNSIERAILEDGTKIIFKLNPQTPDEWYCYNSQLIEYFSINFFNCSLEGLRKEFEKKQFNTPDESRLIDSEFVKIKKTVNDKVREGVSYWYNATYCGDIPRDEDGYKLFLSKRIDFGIKTFLQGKALAEYENFLKTDAKKATNDKDKSVKAKLFHEYLCHDERKKLAEQLRTNFNTEIGKSIRLMLEELIEMQFLAIENRGKKSFYNALKEFFDRDIGSYQSIFDYKLNHDSDKDEIKNIKTKLNFILTNLKGLNESL